MNRIVCAADLHFRPDRPICRKESNEEWIELQFRKFSFLLDYASQNQAVVVVAGDFFHRPTGAPAWLLSRLITTLTSFSEVSVYAIPGQHDLPYHQIDRLRESNLGVLLASGVVHDECSFIDMFPWGENFANGKYDVAATHQMVIRDQRSELYPGQYAKGEAVMGTALLRKNPRYRLIVSGDNHQPFVAQAGHRVLLNPGSMTRQRINETHAPGFFFYDGEEVQRVFYPSEENVMNEVLIERELAGGWAGDPHQIQQLLSAVEEGEEMDFIAAVTSYFIHKRTRPEVQKIVLGE